MYACGECDEYKIFESENGRFLYKKDYFDSYGKDKIFMQKANNIRSMDSKNLNSVIGTNNKERNKFDYLDGEIKYPICYVFYFKGILTNERKWFYEKYNLLKVSDYKIIPDINCIREGEQLN